MFAASRPGISDKTFEEVAKFMPTMAEAAGLTGATPEETFAVGAVLMDRMARGKSAAGLGKSFALQMQADPKLRGKGYLEAVRTVREDFTPEEQKRYLESKETVEFFDIIEAERPKIKANEAALLAERMRLGTPRSEFQQAIARSRSDPRTAAEQHIASSQLAGEISREEHLAVDGAREIAAVERVKTVLRDTGRSDFQVYLGGQAAEALRGFRAPEKAIEFGGAVGGQLGSFATPLTFGPGLHEALGALNSTAEKLDSSAANLDNATRNAGAASYTNRARREQSMPAE
jgi:hypothetical protein